MTRLVIQFILQKGWINDHYYYCYPPALFETTNVLLSPNAAALADAMWKQVPAMPGPATPAQYVLDGGTLLHTILSPSGEKFDGICSPYVQYVLDKYRSPVIVFDGYQNGPSTEDNTHSRRTKSSMAAEVRFTGLSYSSWISLACISEHISPKVLLTSANFNIAKTLGTNLLSLKNIRCAKFNHIWCITKYKVIFYYLLGKIRKHQLFHIIFH